MVYIDPDELKWMPYVQTWITGWKSHLKPEMSDYILDLFSRYVENGLRFIQKKCTQAINQVNSPYPNNGY